MHIYIHMFLREITLSCGKLKSRPEGGRAFKIRKSISEVDLAYLDNKSAVDVARFCRKFTDFQQAFDIIEVVFKRRFTQAIAKQGHI